MSDLVPVLAIPKGDVGRGSPIPFETVADGPALTRRFADDLMEVYLAAKAAGRERVVFILPVGPVGQFELWAERCNAEGVSLCDLVVVNMDEYLTEDGRDLIPTSDPLSFRRHMDARFYGVLREELAPPMEARHFPRSVRTRTPPASSSTRHGGVDACFGGVGITGHVAFNDPPEPGEETSVEAFAALPTRVVGLSRETRLINSVTACRGNLARIPHLAVTVGMREILAARQVRLYMNREWQCAIVRRLLHGPVTPHVPASLLQTHPDVRVVAADLVTDLPEPALR